jgi:protocatechuate 3,4-dioxygenase beta subunit
LGLFVFKKGRLGPGKYWISAVVRSWHPKVLDTVAFSGLTITASSRPDIVLRLKAGAGSVEGSVVDSKGHPVRRATITLEGTKRPSILRYYTAETNAKGRYALDYIPRGTYMGTVDWGEYGSLPVAVVVGKRPAHKDFRVGR